MSRHQGPTDKTVKIQLPSAIQQVVWIRRVAAVGGSVGLQVYTQFVGNNSELKVELTDKSGKSFGNFTDKISANKFWVQIKVPAGAKDELYANVKLTKHGLSMKSDPLIIMPPVQITNLKWGQKEARRSDIVKISADVKGVPDGSEAAVEIWEHDSDGSHDLYTSFDSLIKNSKVEAEWEYEYHEDTDKIPTEDEVKKYGNHYKPPEYFFRIVMHGVQADSGVLLFKDWIELALEDEDGEPIANEKYVLHLPDGTQKNGTLDSQGRARLVHLPPGNIFVEYPDIGGLLSGLQ